jgi:N6-adenosine-specific RNA methylase IME4
MNAADVLAQAWPGLDPPYSTIVADPPWQYGKMNPATPVYTADPGHTSSGRFVNGSQLSDHYSGMTLDEIRGLPVGDLGQDSRLFLWVTSRYLRHAWDVIEAWGFTPQDKHLVWCKPPRATTPVTTEYVLVGKKGTPSRMPWTGTTWYQWPLQPVHSQKPDAFMDLVESWCPGPYVELFGRRPRLGWDHWGHGYEIGVTA